MAALESDKYEKLMGTLGIVLKADDKQLTGKPLMKRVMQIWTCGGLARRARPA